MSVLFYPESIRILGSDANGNNVMLCKMAVDDIANLPAANAFINDGYVLSMGCVATVINDNSKHRLNGSGNWIQIAAGTSTYTRAEIDALLSAIDAEIDTLTPAAIKAVDEGPKNLANSESGSGTRWININVDIPAGTYTVGFANLSGEVEGFSQISLYGDNYSTITSGSKYIDKGTNVYVSNFTATDTIKIIRVYAAGNSEISQGKLVSYTGLFVCTSADWAVSQKFVPYAPTNRQLYEMILQLQGG